jgi:AsmA protein
MAINANARQGARTIVAALTTPITASVDGRSVSLTQVAGDITVEDPALAQKTLKLATTGIASYDGRKEVADLRFSTRFDETTLSSEVAVRGFAPPAVAIDASADKLDVDRYFQPPPPRPGNDSADPREDPKVDLSGLKGLNVNAQARVGQLKARGIRASNVHLVAKIANGRLDVMPLSAGLYGGRVQATASAIADGNRMALDASLFDVLLEPLLKDALDKDILEGRGNVRLAVTTSGGTVGALKKAMNGNGSLALRDGAIKGVNVAQKLRDARSMLSGAKEETQRASTADKTDFSEMTATFVVKNGIATSSDLDAKSPLLRLAGGGSVNLVEAALDYTAKVTVVETLKGQDGRPVNELRGVTVPLRLRGPFEKLSYTVDWSAAAADALKSKAAEKLTPQLKEQEKRVRDKLQDQLKGLLKR